MKIKSPLLTKLAAWLLVASLRLIFRTIRKEFVLQTPGTLAYEADLTERFLYCTWHDSIVMPLFMGVPHHMAAIVSPHQDGSYLAESMHFLRVRPVRGSSGKRGVQALREALEVARDHHITITPDGPRGPRREMKDGVLFLSAKSGRGIVPMAFRCSSAWRVKGKWTDLVIPKPFSRVTMFLGEPIDMPEKLGREQMDAELLRLQQIMDEHFAMAEQTPLAGSALATPADDEPQRNAA